MAKLGIFDSGFGGLTVLKKYKELLPQYSYIYLGDNARAPYGNHSQERIYEYTQQAVEFLFQQGCALVILACNTASAAALRRLQQEWLPINCPERRILGVIRPTVEEVLDNVKSKNIGILGTRATVATNAYTIELKKLAQVRKLQIYQQACPLLVPLIEEGWLRRPETKMILKKYLHQLKTYNLDTLILGCTHYSLLKKIIEKYMGKRIRVFCSSDCATRKLVDYLKRHPEIEQQLEKGDSITFYSTDDPEKFKKLGSLFLGKQIKEVEKVKLD